LVLFEIDRADQVIMVGDRKHDVHGARNLGTKFIGVTWGYGPTNEFSDERVDVTVDAAADLVEAIVAVEPTSRRT
jgi:phosphoglycolate phosphatase